MPVPKRKRSKRRRDKRFANKGLKEHAVATCEHCHEVRLPHTACRFCGYYKGIKIYKTVHDRSIIRKEKKSASASRTAQPDASESQTQE